MGPNNRRGTYIYAIVMLILAMVIFQFINGASVTPPVEYNQIIGYFQQEKVAQYRLDFNTRELSYVLKEERDLARSEGREPKAVVTTVPDINLFVRDVHELVNEYNEKHPGDPVVQYYVPIKEPSPLLNWVPMLLLAGSMIFMWYLIMRQTRGTGNPLSFSKAKPKQPDDKNRITFDDVAGADEEKQELEEIVEFLKTPERFNSLGARIPKGVLLMGPPGTGKTLLAKAVAGEAGVPFFSISGSDFVEMYVGVGASRVRDLFEQAKKNAPSIIFIDEIDAVGRHRGAGLGGGHDEREQTLNQLLVEMDGFGTNTGVIVMAATNRKDILDPALMRPGRFDRQIIVNYPDVKGREAILRVHTRKKPIGPDVDLAVIARTTGGFTGADLENLCNEAALLAARRHKKAITMEEIEEATIKVVVGPEKPSRVITDQERTLTAYHEAGHAIVTYHCPSQDKVHQVSIIPRGMAGGFTLSLPEKDDMYRTKTHMEEDVCVLLGGRVSEQLVLGEISTGASNDLERATKIARSMVTRYGFSEKLGPMVYGNDKDEVFLGMEQGRDRSYSEEVAAAIDGEIRRIIDNAYDRATQILQSENEKLHQLAAYLKEFEKIEGPAFARLMDGSATMEELRQEALQAAEEARLKQEAQERRAQAAEAAQQERREAARLRHHNAPPPPAEGPDGGPDPTYQEPGSQAVPPPGKTLEEPPREEPPEQR